MMVANLVPDVAAASSEIMPQKTSRSKEKLVGQVISSAFIALVALIVVAVIIVPQIMGAVPLTVLTGSMMPNFRPGDIVVVQPTPVEKLQIGDVITFQPVSGNPALTTHRIVSIFTFGGQVETVTTRGDANNVDDSPIIPAQINGRVVYSVPLVGHLTTGRNSALVGTTIVGGGLVLYSIQGIIKNLREKRRAEASDG